MKRIMGLVLRVAGVGLVVAAVALVVWGAREPAPTTALAPAPTPTLTPVPPDPWPTPGPYWTPTPLAIPRPTPRGPSGGPYISEAQAIAIVTRGLPPCPPDPSVLPKAGKCLDRNVPPRAIFTPAKGIRAIIGDPRPPGTSEREKWVVILEGRFQQPKVPYGFPLPYYRKLYIIIDATDGQVDAAVYREKIP